MASSRLFGVLRQGECLAELSVNQDFRFHLSGIIITNHVDEIDEPASKRPPKRIAVIDPESCFGAFACSICQAACPVEDCIVEEPDAYGRIVCAVRIDKCIGCGLCVTLGNTTAPQPRDFGCPADYDAIDMHDYDDAVKFVEADVEDERIVEQPSAGTPS